MQTKLFSLPFVKLYIICLCLCFCIFVSAQEKTLTPEQFEQKFNDCYTFLIEGDPEQAFLCLEKLKLLIEQSGYYQGITRYYTQMSELYLIRGEPEKSLELIAEGYKKYHKKLSENEKDRFKILELSVLGSQNKNQEVLLRIQEIMPEIKNERHKAALYSMKASGLMEIGEYEKAAADYYNALRIFKSQKDALNITTIYNRLGLLSQSLKEPQKALTYYKQALRYALQVNSKPDLQSVYSNLGANYRELDSIEKSLEYYQKSAELAKRYGNPIDIARVLLNTGDVYLGTGDFSRAFANFNESLAISKKENIPIGIMYNYTSLGRAYTQTNQFEKSRVSYDSALVYAQSLNMPAMEADIYYGFYEMYQKTRNFEKSLFFHIKSDSIKKTLFNEEKQKAIAEIEIRYQTELKDQQIEKMHYAFENKRAQNRTLIVGIVSLGVIAGFIIFFLIYRNRTLRDLYERNVELMNSFSHKMIDTEAPNGTSGLVNNEEDNLKSVFNKLLYSLETEKIYKDPELSLAKAADTIKSNEKYVSSAISSYAKTNYSNFINSYRIHEAKILIYENNNLNINEVMYACGFNSRTTFYDAFKKQTGMSPKQFKEMKGYNFN